MAMAAGNTSPWYGSLAKEVKGERPISLFTMLHRIWSRTRKYCAAEWCGAKAGFWDDAVGGRSPLQALRRLVADKLTQHTDNQEACTVLFDVESIYDSIALSLVTRAGLKLAYFPVPLCLLLLTCAGVRLITAGCSGFFQCNRHQQWCGSGLRSRQPRCDIGAPRHPAEVARAASIHHDFPMGG